VYNVQRPCDDKARRKHSAGRCISQTKIIASIPVWYQAGVVDKHTIAIVAIWFARDLE
jgi:hypothetical protein